jgi:hypothetical protein
MVEKAHLGGPIRMFIPGQYFKELIGRKVFRQLQRF